MTTPRTTHIHHPRIIEKLPKMKIKDTMQLWNNCIENIADKKRRKMHSDARAILDAISVEWIRRGKTPPDPAEFFNWPSTEASAGRGGINTHEWLEEGLLKYMGYRVGGTEGLSKAVRERILVEIFQGGIPPVFPHEYLNEWSDSGTPQRLKKLAETIAALTRNAKRRRDSRMATAVMHWEQDLEFLYYEYYVEKFHFGWPSTETL